MKNENTKNEDMIPFRVSIYSLDTYATIDHNVMAITSKDALLVVIASISESEPTWKGRSWSVQCYPQKGAFILKS